MYAHKCLSPIKMVNHTRPAGTYLRLRKQAVGEYIAPTADYTEYVSHNDHI